MRPQLALVVFFGSIAYARLLAPSLAGISNRGDSVAVQSKVHFAPPPRHEGRRVFQRGAPQSMDTLTDLRGQFCDNVEEAIGNLQSRTGDKILVHTRQEVGWA